MSGWRILGRCAARGAGTRASILAAGVLTLGSGAGVAVADPLPPQLHTVAGGGSCAASYALNSGGGCDNVRATSTSIAGAQSVSALPDGSFLYADYFDGLVRLVTADGRVTTVAGDTTTRTDAPDGTLAVKSGLNGPVAVAALPSGGFLVTEDAGSVVRVVSSLDPATATITTIAGTGKPGMTPATASGIPATATPLDYPADAEPTPDGGVLVADRYANAVRYLSAAAPGATMSTVAGGGSCEAASSSCEGAPAAALTLHDPVAVSPLPDGSGGYLLTERGAGTVLRIAADTPLAPATTVAGTAGRQGFAGDGGPATGALLNHPAYATTLADGTVVLADTDNERVRRVDPGNGTITTLAGNGRPGHSGDGANATDGAFTTPLTLAALPGGLGLLVADRDNDVIRAVTNPPVTTVTLDPPTPNGVSDGWYTSVKVRVTSSEPGKVNCVLDPGQPPPAFDAFVPGCDYAKGKKVTDDGVHTVYAASSNAFKDKELPGPPVSFKVDSHGPTMFCSNLPTFIVGQDNALVLAKAYDNVSGPTQPTFSTYVDTNSLGPRVAVVVGYDRAGNTSSVPCGYLVLPDEFAPLPQLRAVLTPTPTPRLPRPPRGKRSHRPAAPRRHTARTFTVTALELSRVPDDAAIRVTCRGRGCPFHSRRCPGPECRSGRPDRQGLATVRLSGLFAGHRLPARAVVQVTLTRDLTTTRRYTVVAGSGGTAVVMSCLDPETRAPEVCPPSPARASRDTSERTRRGVAR